MIRKQLFYLMLCTCVLCSCEKDILEPEIPEKPPIENPDEPEQPEKPEEKPSTDGIINFKNEFMIVGQNSWWYSVAYGNGKIVAVGSNRYVTTSIDGNNWTTPKQLMNDGNAWYTVTYSNGKFVIVGSGGNIATSTDGINWSESQKIGTKIWNAVAYGNDTFVIVGGSFDKGGYISTSKDGENWASPELLDATYCFYGVCAI